jgi:hypothetical protein
MLMCRIESTDLENLSSFSDLMEIEKGKGHRGGQTSGEQTQTWALSYQMFRVIRNADVLGPPQSQLSGRKGPQRP